MPILAAFLGYRGQIFECPKNLSEKRELILPKDAIGGGAISIILVRLVLIPLSLYALWLNLNSGCWPGSGCDGSNPLNWQGRWALWNIELLLCASTFGILLVFIGAMGAVVGALIFGRRANG